MNDFEHLDPVERFEVSRAFVAQVRERARLRRRLRLTSISALIVLTVAGSAALLAGTQPEQIDVMPPGDGDTRAITFLLAGVDTCWNVPCVVDRGGASSNADALMLVRVIPSHSTVEVVSIPRDLYVETESGADPKKINSLSVAEQLAFLSERFGLGVDHYVELDMNGFVDIADSLGGVNLRVAEPLVDQESGLRVEPAECRKFSGSELLALVRSRRLVGPSGVAAPGDLSRVVRQQELAAAVLHSASTASDSQVVEAVQNLVRHARVDANFDLSSAVSIARAIRVMENPVIHVGTLPVAVADDPNFGGAQSGLISTGQDPWQSVGPVGSRPVVSSCL